MNEKNIMRCAIYTRVSDDEGLDKEFSSLDAQREAGEYHIVLDAFGGLGSTMIACEKTGRRARLIELEPKYADVIVKRWQEFTGKKAIHAATGQEFQNI